MNCTTRFLDSFGRFQTSRNNANRNEQMTTFTTDSPIPIASIFSAQRRIANRIWICIVEFQVRRAQTASLSCLKSRDLRDIGLIDNDISAANSLPISANAAMALHRARQGRIGNW
jgi:uncharacterized protein YjiS (DUF1127 family)